MTQANPLAVIRAALAADRQNLRDAIKRVPKGLLNQRPSPERWSVAEVIEHLAIIEAATVGFLTPLVAGAPILPDDAQPVATPIPRERLRDRTTRITAPEIVQPKGTLSFDEALAALEQSRTSLLMLLEAAEGRDLTAVGRPHPRLGPLDGYQWLAIVGAHEERHALQILEIAAELSVDPA